MLMKKAYRSLMLLTLLVGAHHCNLAASRGGSAPQPAAVPAAAVKSLPGGQKVATSLSTISATAAAAKPAAPVQVQAPAPSKPAVVPMSNVTGAQVKTAMSTAPVNQVVDIYKASQATIGQILNAIQKGSANNKYGHFIGETGLSLSGPSKELIDNNQNVLVQITPPSKAVVDNITAKTPAGPLRDQYLALVPCVPVASFLAAIKAAPGTQIVDNAGTPVNQLYFNDPNPAAYIAAGGLQKFGGASAIKSVGGNVSSLGKPAAPAKPATPAKPASSKR